MRIIGGNLKKKKLFAVPGSSTRPTSDRLRESIFNILSYDVTDAIVLDLFAGTGALGLEALSRNAEKAVFIDNQSCAVSIIKKNISACSLEKRTQVLKWDICKDLSCLNSVSPLFNLVFMDPPYSMAMIPKALLNLKKSCCLAENSKLVIEHASSDITGSLPDSFFLTDYRQYGKTSLSFLAFKE